jgi:magnesium transporter
VSEVHARIRAREEARQAPREFLLYSPRLAEASSQKPKTRARAVDVGSEPPGVLRTTALAGILQELSKSMKTTARSRRSQALSAAPAHAQDPNIRAEGTSEGLRFRDFALPTVPPSSDYRPVEIEDARMRRRGRKGKHRSDAPDNVPSATRMVREPTDADLDRAWWLDVASPTWEDMRAIGKVLVFL